MSGNEKKLIVRLLIYGTGCVLILVYIFICQKGYGIPCLFNEIFDIVCPSCGASRAFIAIILGEFQSAIGFNPVFTLALYPILFILLLQDIFVAIQRVIKKQDEISIIEFVFKFRQKGAKK
ncbi:MAG: DUF2752 domain-containing protein [Oscillospiraceae bacterium]